MIFNTEIRHTEFLKKSFVVLLREAFKHPEMPEEYRYSEVEASSMIGIYIAFPIRAERFPLLIVSTGAVDYRVKSFEDEVTEETRDENGVITGLKRVAPILTPVSVKVFALTTQDRDKLTDIVAFLIRRIFRDKFALEGIGYSNIKIGADAEETWMNQVLYSKEITVECYTEVEDTIPQNLIAAITNVSLKEITVLDLTQ